MFLLTTLIPLPYRILAIALLGAALVGFGWLKGAQHGEAKLEREHAAALKEGVRIITLRGAVTTKVETKYLPQIVRAGVITETITHEIHATAPVDAAPVAGYFRVWHDAAAAGRLPEPTAVRNGAAVDVETAAATVAENYGACRKDQLKLQALQEWVTEQLKVK